MANIIKVIDLNPLRKSAMAKEQAPQLVDQSQTNTDVDFFENANSNASPQL